MQRDVRNIITTAAVNAITFSTKVTLGRSTTLSRPRCFEHSPYTSYFSTQRCLGVIKATKLSGWSAAALSMLLEQHFTDDPNQF